MEIIEVDIDTFINLHPHCGESLGSQAVAIVKVALIPSDTIE
jgi:hypothetical protein